jgi:poly(A) polymerase
VRFIGDARERIREDHLRILRYYRFQARFGAELDPEAEEACAELAPTLKGLSRERVAMELLNLLALPDPAPTVARMEARGVLPCPPGGWPFGVTRPRGSHSARKRGRVLLPTPLRRLAALLPADPRAAEPGRGPAAALGDAAQAAGYAASRDGAPGDPRALAYRLGRDEAVDRLLLAGADSAALTGLDHPPASAQGRRDRRARCLGGAGGARMLREIETTGSPKAFPDAERVDENCCRAPRALEGNGCRAGTPAAADRPAAPRATFHMWMSFSVRGRQCSPPILPGQALVELEGVVASASPPSR